MNLAVNARDAMPDGGTLTITASRDLVARAGPGGPAVADYIRITVADTGEGMGRCKTGKGGRTVFHNEAAGAGNGPWPRNGQGLLRAVRRWFRARERGWRWDDRHAVAAESGGRRPPSGAREEASSVR